jgi:Zn-dependent M28 family amino/carboxypeptidase
MSIATRLLRLFLRPIFRKYVEMPGRSYSGPFLPLSEPERETRERVEWYVRHLSEEIGDRSIGQYDNLTKAARYIENTFWSLGYDCRKQDFTVGYAPMQNVEIELKGETHPDEIIVVGAHYDTVNGTPGADDNASGVAAVLELARLLKGVRLARTVRLVAFANEEVSKDKGHTMGSYAYAQECRLKGEKIVGMLSLEMLGYYSDEPGSQQYPFPFSLFYPQQGNFIAFVGDYGSKQWVCDVISAFRKHTSFPSEGGAVPTRFSDISRSDHWSFWQFGYPGLMVTDTSNFRFKLYHTWKDTPDKLSFDKLARVVTGLAAAVVEIANQTTARS